MNTLKHAACAAALAVTASVSLAQQTITVPTDLPTLELALNPAVSGLAAGDTIELLGTAGYFGAYTITTPDITIRGVGATPIVINPFNTGRAFTVTDTTTGSLTLENLEIRNGDAGAQSGGAVYSISSDLVRIIDCDFIDNAALSGGAVFVVDGDLEIVGSNFTNNEAATFAGAVRSGGDGVRVSISGATFVGNHAFAGNGGGLDHSGAGSTLDVSDSVFSMNSCTIAGGGVWSNFAVRNTFRNVDFLDNTAAGTASADAGGAIVVGSASVLVEDCDFERNTCPGNGGGLRFSDSVGVIVDSRFRENEASAGGAFLVVGSAADAAIYNSTFTDNSARLVGPESNRGGAIQAITSSGTVGLRVFNSLFTGNTAVTAGAIDVSNNANVVVTNCTFFENDADTIGGAVRRSSPSATAIVNNSIAFGNFPSDSQIAVGGQGLDEVNFSLIEGGYTGVGVNNIDADPLFANPAAGDFSLLPGSPAIDAGSSARYGAGPLSDLAGAVRGQNDPATPDIGEAIVGAVIDVGAFEFNPAATDPTPCPGDLTGDDAVNADDLLQVLGNFGQTCP